MLSDKDLEELLDAPLEVVEDAPMPLEVVHDSKMSQSLGVEPGPQRMPQWSSLGMHALGADVDSRALSQHICRQLEEHISQQIKRAVAEEILDAKMGDAAAARLALDAPRSCASSRSPSTSVRQ